MRFRPLLAIVSLAAAAAAGRVLSAQPSDTARSSIPPPSLATAPPAVPAVGEAQAGNPGAGRPGAIAAGELFTCAVTMSGGVQCWGRNSDGQLGDGTTGSRGTPADVAGLITGVSAVTAGSRHACALTSAGGVKCWGENGYGQLGDGGTSDRRTPGDVEGLARDVVALTAGKLHTCALTRTGGVKCWGNNGFAQLGDGTATTRLAPVDVAGLADGVAAIVAGSYHTCALTSAGGVKCWGHNSDGQLGDGTGMGHGTAADVDGLTAGVAVISAGEAHTCAVMSGGGVMCWGRNDNGELGDGTTTRRLSPVAVAGLTTGAIAVAAGYSHTCALTDAGGIKCWGNNQLGRLGTGTTAGSRTPVDVVGLPAGGSAVAAGYSHTCALDSAGGVACWGDNSAGQLGRDSSTSSPVPVAVNGLTGEAGAAAIGYAHTCALTSDGRVACWGDNALGQLGDGTHDSRFTPRDVAGFTGGARGVAAGYYHACAITAAGGVKCWGDNYRGKLGDGTTTSRPSPVDVTGLAGGVVAIAAGMDHTCALTGVGGVKCWGNNSSGQLGDGTTTSDVTGLPPGVVAVAAGGEHTCALTGVGGVKCWGNNSSGQLGDGTTTKRVTPVDVTGLDSGVVAIAAGPGHTCAVTGAGGVKCWGGNWRGELGDGTTSPRSTPGDVAGLTSGVVALAAGYSRTCALTAAGGVKCWGENGYGQLGDGTRTHSPVPVDVVGLGSGATALAAGYNHSCAITAGGIAKCWGMNWDGQLGNGSARYSQVPLAVVLVMTPIVTWENPSSILAGTALSAAQLNATSSTPGTFVYTPPAGTVLEPGTGQALSVTFTPADTANYRTITRTVTIDVVVPPTISTHPASVTVAPLTWWWMHAGAYGVPAPTAQWQVSTDGGATWSDLAGETGTTISATSPLGASGTRYRAVFTSAAGTATTRAATLTVIDPAPAIVVHPNDQTVNEGDPVTFAAEAEGVPAPMAQWQVSTDGGLTWTSIPGATAATYRFIALAGDGGKRFRAVFTNDSGSAVTKPATLAVSAVRTTLRILTHPSSQTVAAGSTATFTAAASADPDPTVQWQVSTDRGSTWRDVAGATHTTYSFTAEASDDGTRVRAVFTSLPWVSAATNAAVLTVAEAAEPARAVIAGTGVFGFDGDGGPGTAALLASPNGVAADASGNAYIADYGNMRVRMVSAATGIITTVAGSGPVPAPGEPQAGGFGGDGGPATAAMLQGPTGVATDVDGNLFIVDWGNHRVRKVSAATGIITTVAGSGPVTDDDGNEVGGFGGDGGLAVWAKLNSPWGGIAIDPAGNLYVADTGNHRVRVVSAETGIITTVAGSGTPGSGGDGGPAAAAGLSSPHGVALDAQGNLYLADTGNNRVRAVSATAHTIDTVIGPDRTSNPRSVALGRTGNVYVADYANHRVLAVSAGTGVVTTLASATRTPTGISLDGRGNLFVVEAGNHRVLKIGPIPAETVAPVVVTHPGSLTAPLGSTATLEAAAQGIPSPSVRWQESANGGATWIDIAGATTARYTFELGLFEFSKLYRAVFTNVAGSTATDWAIVRRALPPVVTVHPQSQTVVTGGAAVFTAAANATPAASVAWEVSTDGGVVFDRIPGASAIPFGFAVSPADDGKRYRAVFTNTAGSAVSSAATLTVYSDATDGTLDAGFDPGANGPVRAVAVQADGKILVGGDFTTLGGGGSGTTERRRLGRLNAGGSLDASFNPGADAPVRALAVQADGKILVGGDFTTLGGGGSGTTERRHLGRLNADGSQDTSFNPGANGPVRALAIQADGKIVVGGDFTSIGTDNAAAVPRHHIARLNADGSLDADFNPGADGPVRALAIQTDGKIVIGGDFTSMGTDSAAPATRNHIARLNADGSLDTGFDPGANDAVWAVAVQEDGKILVGGAFTMLGGGAGTIPRSHVGRLTSDGSVDPGFVSDANGLVAALALQPYGKVVLGGDFTTLGGASDPATRYRIGRLNADGSPDDSIDPGANGSVLTLGVQPDGNVVVGGAFTTLGGGGEGTAPRRAIARLAMEPPGNVWTLTVSIQGTGTGTVMSSPAGIDCGSTCRASVTRGTTVYLWVSVVGPNRFVGWGGDCRGTNSSAQVVLSEHAVCTALFGLEGDRTLTVKKEGVGSGIVRSSTGGIECGAVCLASVANGTSVTLTASVVAPNTTVTWGGDCGGTGPTATLVMDADKTCYVTQNPPWTSIGPNEWNIRALVVDAHAPGTLYAGTWGGGVFKTTDAGRSWRATSPLPANQLVNTIAVDPVHPQTLYVGINWGGTYKSTDGGEQWVPLGLDAGGGWVGVTAFAIDPADPRVVYTGTDEGGVSRSDDGGLTWRTINQGLSDGEVFALAIAPSDTHVIYAGTGSGVFKSVDGGGSWRAASAGLPVTRVTGLQVDPRNPDVVYAVPYRGVFKSTDGGVSWSNAGPEAIAFVIDRVHPDTLYALTDWQGLFKSTDGGVRWDVVTGSLSLLGRALAIAPSDSDTLYIWAEPWGDYDSGVFRSSDAGQHWQVGSKAGLAAASVKALAFGAAGSGVLYAATERGVHRKRAGAVAWTDPSPSSPKSVLALALHSTAVYAAGYGGVHRSTDGGDTWSAMNEGLPRPAYVWAIAIDPVTPQHVYAALDSGVYKSVDGGAHWSAASSGIGFGRVTSLAIDPLTPATVYAGAVESWEGVDPDASVYKSTDGGATWRGVRLFPQYVDSVYALAIDPTTPSTIYAASYGTVYKSTDAGEHWIPGAIAVGVDNVSSVVIDPANPQVLYASKNTSGVFRSVDAGASWSLIWNTGQWAMFHGGSGPDVTTVAVSPEHPLEIYAGTSGAGVWATGVDPAPAPFLASAAPNRGAASGGTVVTLTGAQLAAAEVEIGGVRAAVLSASGDGGTLTVRTAARAVPGACDVVVTNPDGQQSALPGAFTYEDKIAPAITWASPAPITAGTALSAAQLNATASVAGTFAYAPPAGAVLAAGIGQTLLVTFMPADAADYTTASKTVTIDVLPAGVPAIANVTPGTGPIGSGVELTGTGFAGAIAVTFHGVPAAYTIVSNTQITTAVPAGATTGPVRVTAPGGTAASATHFVVTNQRAARSVPGCYVPGYGVMVSLEVVPAPGVFSHAAADMPPEGWTIGTISDGGVWDAPAGHVRWGPFDDATARTLTYVVTPPFGTNGAAGFVGIASFDGVDVALGGPAALGRCEQHPADADSDFRVAIGEVTAYGAAWKKGGAWAVPPDPVPIGYVTRAGYLWRTGETYHRAEGDCPMCWVSGTLVPKPAPEPEEWFAFEEAVAPRQGPWSAVFGWTGGPVMRGSHAGTAVREAPATYVPGAPLAVTITVTPNGDVQAWAVEEAVPAGWRVSAVSAGGHWDEKAGAVRWGPFFDETAQTLRYTLMPPAGAFEPQTLSGTASFDGTDVAVTGARTIQRAPIVRPGMGDRREARGKGQGAGGKGACCSTAQTSGLRRPVHDRSQRLHDLPRRNAPCPARG